MADEIAKLIRDVGKIPPDLRKELRPGLKHAAKPVLEQARRNASWSTRIPKATRIQTRFSGKDPGVSIVVNRKKAPHARPFEHGDRPGKFRHPVFGRDVWVEQKARPFLHPALVAKGDEAEKRITRVVDVVTRSAGFK